MSIYLGIDIGTSGTKTIAMAEDGTVIADAAEGYPVSYPKPLWSEQDPDLWWNATVKSVRKVMKLAKLKPADVKAIGLSGQMHGSVFLDKNNEVIRPALLWSDQRTAAECAEIESRAGGREELIKMVANPALTGFTAPKILWLRNREPRNFAKLRKVLLPKDEIRRRLTGEFATEVSDASGMLLLDVAKREWSTQLLSSLELDRDLLGTVYESEDVTGKLTKEAAKKLGLTTDCMVVGGAGDCAANAVGSGVVKKGILASSLGTSGVMFVHSDEMAADPQGRLHTFCHAVRGKWHMMGVTLCAAGTLEWFVQKLCCEMRGSKGKTDPYATLLKEAAAIQPGSEGLMVLPYLAGERTPHADPDARGCVIGITLKHDRGHVARAILEGVTYSLRESLEVLNEMSIPVRQVRAGGGGAKSQLWRQMQADVFGRKVVTLNAEQGPAYGVALLAATGAGAYKNIQEACGATIRTVSEIVPDRQAKKVYDRAFPVYQGLYQSLKEDFKKLSHLDD